MSEGLVDDEEDCVDVEEGGRCMEDIILSLLPNLRTYGVINVVIIVTTPTMGKTAELTDPVSCPTFATTSDSSPFAEAIPRPVLIEVTVSYLDFSRMAVTIRSFDANDVKIRIKACTIKKGTRDTSISAPIDMKNSAANTSLNGTVTTLATFALLDSATSTPPRNAPVATDRPREFATNDKPNASPNIEIRSKA